MVRQQVPPVDLRVFDYELPTGIEVPADVEADQICCDMVARFGEACQKQAWTFIDDNFRPDGFFRDQVRLRIQIRIDEPPCG